MFELLESAISLPWTLSPAGSPARTSATQGSEQESTESEVGSGLSMRESLANYDPASCSWRTSQLCLDGEWAEFSETWPRSGMTRNGELFRRPTLERPTSENASGLWPTMRAADGERGGRGDPIQGIRGNPNSHYRWPTPSAQMPGAGPNNAKVQNLLTGNRHSFYLTQAVEAERQVPGIITRQWPTPSSNNGTGGATGLAGGSGNRKKLYAMLGETEDKKLGCQSLNPYWVEWLMGFPLGWSALEDSETL